MLTIPLSIPVYNPNLKLGYRGNINLVSNEDNQFGFRLGFLTIVTKLCLHVIFVCVAVVLWVFYV